MTKKEKQQYNNEYYKWKEYSNHCPWKLGEVCKATTMTCTYTHCSPWYFITLLTKIMDKKKNV